MNNYKQMAVLAIAPSLLIMSCSAPHPKVLQQGDIDDIKKLAVVTSLSKNELQVLDHSRMMEYSSTSQYGAVGGLLEGLVVGGMASGQIRSSLGGDPDSLRQVVSDLDAKTLFDDNFLSIFTVSFGIVGPQEVDSNIRLAEKPGSESVADEKVRAAIYEKLRVDTVLEIDFVYGLAAYAGGLAPSAVISGVVTVVDVQENKVVMKKRMSSDSYYKKHYTVEEFSADGGQLFRREIREAARGFAHIVASEFGVELSHKQESYWQSEE